MERLVLTRRQCAVLLGSLFGHSLALRGQESPDIRVDVELVNLLFTVRKAKTGELAPNLTKDDFLVFEDGKQQTIANFSRDQNLPLELGMLIDISGSQANLIDTEKQAGSSFFGNVMRRKDESFLLSFGHDTVLVQDFTSSVPKLQSALNSIKADTNPNPGNQRRGGNGGSGGGYPGGGGGRTSGGIGWPGGGMGWPGGGGMGGGRRGGGRPPDSGSQQRTNGKGTLLFDAIYLACTDEINHKQGRKALFLITDGEDRGSYYTRSQAVEAAQRANTILYSIYYVDPKRHGRDRNDGQASIGPGDLKHMSNETGGRVFTVDKDHTLEDIFTELQAELRSQYSIGYKSTNPERNGEYREIEIRPKNADFEVQGRKGYYATKNRIT